MNGKLIVNKWIKHDIRNAASATFLTRSHRYFKEDPILLILLR